MQKSSIPLARRKSSVRYTGGGSQEYNEMSSVSRPRPSTSALGMSFMQNQHSLMPPDFPPSSSRSSRSYGLSGPARRKRSSSQEPPRLDKRRTFTTSPSADHHLPSAGLLATPMRMNNGMSPFNLASVNRSSASSRRHSSKLHIIPNTNLKIKDERKIGDKVFKANAYATIQRFLGNTGVKLKPLSNASFIQAFNAIYKELDPNTQVTKADYADKISNIIKNLGYPAQISKTSFIAVNSGHAESQVLAMLSWLVECIEFLKCVNVSLEERELYNEQDKLETAIASCNLRLYTEYKSGGEGVITQERVGETFLLFLGESANEEEELKNSIQTLSAEIRNLEEDPKKIEDQEKVTQITIAEDRITSVKQEIESLIAQSGVLKAKINTEKESIKTIELDNGRFIDMCSELSDKIDRQTMKHTDRDKILEKCQQYNLDIKRQNEHLKMVEHYVGTADIKITKLQNEVCSVIHDINAIVLEHQLNEQYKWTHNPTHSDANEQLKRAMELWDKATETLESENDKFDQLLFKLPKDLEDMQDTKLKQDEDLASILNECAKIDCQINDEQGTGRLKEQELKEKLEDTRKRCHKLAKELEKEPKIEELKEAIQKIEDEVKKTEKAFSEKQNFYENHFFPKLHQIHFEHMEELRIEADGNHFKAVTCKIANLNK